MNPLGTTVSWGRESFSPGRQETMRTADDLLHNLDQVARDAAGRRNNSTAFNSDAAAKQAAEESLAAMSGGRSQVFDRGRQTREQEKTRAVAEAITRESTPNQDTRMILSGAPTAAPAADDSPA